MNLFSGIRQLCLYDPETGDRVNLKHISTNSEYVPENNNSETGTGVITGTKTHNPTIVFFDNPDGMVDQMEQWENDSTPLCWVALLGNAVQYWNVPTPIDGFIDSLSANARDGVSPFQFSMEHVGFDADIVKGINFVRAMMKRNSAGRTQYNQQEDYLPLRRVGTTGTNRWQLRSAANDAFEKTQTGVGTLRIPFPFPGVVINASYINIDGSVVVQRKNFAGSVIAGTTLNVAGANSAITINDGTFWLDFEFGSGLWHSLTARIAGTEYVNA